MPPVSVLIKPASSKCNMRCGYCFYHSISGSRKTADFGFMSPETIELIVEKVLRFAAGRATFSFQGGEPTLCGLSFFKNLVELQKKYNVNRVAVQNCLQTNGLLLDEAWCRFLRDNGFLVGLSLDGYRALNDRNRVDAAGRGAFDRIIEAAGLLNGYSVEYNVLFVVTDYAALHSDRLYGFFKSNGFNYLQFIPCIEPRGGAGNENGPSLSPENYTLFLKVFFDRWKSDLARGREISIRYFDNLVGMVMGAPPESCAMTGACGCQFVFEADGGVYPCDFYVTDEWRLGDIRRHDMMELYRSENSIRFMNASRRSRPECVSCRVYALCRGGCRRDREDDATGELGPNRFCESYKAFLGYAYPGLVEIAARVHNSAAGKRRAD